METSKPLKRPYSKFITLAIVSGLLLGSLSGFLFLHWLRLGTVGVTLLQKQAHAHLQLFGFALTMIMGVAYHALPNFTGTVIENQKAVTASFWAMAAAVIAWSIQLLGFGTPSLSLFASISALASSIAFAIIVSAIGRMTADRSMPYLKYVQYGSLGWIIAAASSCLSTASAFLPIADRSLLFEATYSLALYLGILPWTLGMTLRGAMMFIGMAEPRENKVTRSLKIITGSALLAALFQVMQAFLGYQPWVHFEATAFLLLAMSVVHFLWATGLLKKQTPRAPEPFPFSVQIRLAHWLLALFAMLLGAWAIDVFWFNRPERGLLADGARHAFTSGYLLLLMTGMMARVLPIFSGKRLVAPRIFFTGTILIALGALLRETQVLAYYFESVALVRFSAHTGFLVLAGLVTSVTCVLLSICRRGAC